MNGKDETPYLGPCFTAEKRDPETCPHLPRTQYAWFADDCGERILCAVCFACNTILAGEVRK